MEVNALYIDAMRFVPSLKLTANISPKNQWLEDEHRHLGGIWVQYFAWKLTLTNHCLLALYHLCCCHCESAAARQGLGQLQLFAICFVLEGEWFHYTSCFFGCKWAAYWFSRVGAFLVRLPPMDLAEAWPFLVRRWRVDFVACAHCTSGGVFSHHVFGCTWRATELGKAFVGHLYALVGLGFQLGRSSCMGARWQTCKACSIFGTAARAEAQGWAQDVGKLHWFARVGLWRHLLA